MEENKNNLIVEILKTIPEVDDVVHKSVYDAVNKRLDLHQNLIYFALIVVILGFAAIVITSVVAFTDSNRYKADRYSEYSQQLKILQSELNTQKIEAPKK